MQTLIEHVVRWIGYFALRMVTLGRYRGGRKEDRLPEGGIGLALLAAATYVVYTLVG